MPITPSPNPNRTALYNERIEDGPLTARQRAIADAVRLCRNTWDFTSAPSERVTQITVAKIAVGTTPELAAKLIQDGITAARAEIDRLQAVLDALGPEAFTPMPQGVPARPLEGATRHAIVVNAMRWADANGETLTRAGDTPLVKGPNGYDVG